MAAPMQQAAQALQRSSWSVSLSVALAAISWQGGVAVCTDLAGASCAHASMAAEAIPWNGIASSISHTSTRRTKEFTGRF